MNSLARLSVMLSAAALLAGCAAMMAPQAPPAAGGAGDQIRPQARPDTQAAAAPAGGSAALRPPSGARTVEQFDTTSQEERSAAVAAAAVPPRSGPLGQTIASLGDPARPGFWIETPLVSQPGKGRVSYGGKSVQVDLIPISGPSTAGSRMSLAAMRLIEAPLTGLPEVTVFAED